MSLLVNKKLLSALKIAFILTFILELGMFLIFSVSLFPICLLFSPPALLNVIIMGFVLKTYFGIIKINQPEDKLSLVNKIAFIVIFANIFLSLFWIIPLIIFNDGLIILFPSFLLILIINICFIIWLVRSDKRANGI